MKKWLSCLLALLIAVSATVTALAESVDDIVDLYIQMTVTQEDGVIVADLIDDRGGTVSSWPVSLQIDGVQVDTVTTDSDGIAVFEYAIPEDAQEIACVAQDGQFESYRFNGCTVYLDPITAPTDEWFDPDEEDTTSSDETDPTDETSATTSASAVTSTTAQTQTTFATPLTTMVKNDRVAINVEADDALLGKTLATAADLNSRARLWMDQELYISLVSTSNATLHLRLELNEAAGDISKLIAAKNTTPAYASYEDAAVKGVAMDLSIVYVDETSHVPLEIEDGLYAIELPVPETLKYCEKIAVGVCTADGLASLVEVKPSGGILNFTIQRFQTLALVGFGDQGATLAPLSQTPWLLIVIVVLGLLLIVGGIVLLVLVSFRRKKTVASQAKAHAETIERVMVALDADETPAIDDDREIEKRENAVMMELDEQSELNAAEREIYRAKADTQPIELSSIPEKAVSPARPIETDSVDAMLDEMLNDLEDI